MNADIRHVMDPLPKHQWATSPELEGLRTHLLVTMIRIRCFEERVFKEYTDHRIPGFTHLYIGEEACATGVCASLEKQDYITSTHRGHGHAIAKGVPLAPMMAELYGKVTGTCRGRGGSMHIADFSAGMLGANGIVGGGFGLAVGAAVASLRLGNDRVAVCFFGDGGINKGTFHEAMNFAAVQSLPVVFVCENNQYAQYTAIGRMTGGSSLADRAGAYGAPGYTIDGNDVLAVFEASRTAVARARNGGGPSLLVLNTYRFSGHSVGDPEAYRDAKEVEDRRNLDPIARYEAWLDDYTTLAENERQSVWRSAESEVAAAVTFAEESPEPLAASALDYLLAPTELVTEAK